MEKLNNGDMVQYRYGLRFLYIGNNPLKETDSIVMKADGTTQSLPTDDLKLYTNS